MSMTDADAPLTVAEIAAVRGHLDAIERLVREFDASCQALVQVMRMQSAARAADDDARDAAIQYLYSYRKHGQLSHTLPVL